MATIFGIFAGIWIICLLLQEKTEKRFQLHTLHEEDKLYSIQPIFEESKE